MSDKIRKVVFVDDDLIMGLISQRLLEQMKVAQEIVVFSDSIKALEYLKMEYAINADQSQPGTADLILLDIEMPGKGGFEILDTLRTDEKEGRINLDNCYFVIITSFKGPKEEEKAKAYQVVDILEKPLKMPHVTTLIETIFNMV